MNSRSLTHLARALALVLLIAVVAGLAASNAAWAGPLEAQRGRSTVPKRGTDLAIRKDVRRNGFGHLIFTIVVTNNGPIAAEDVVVTDIIGRRLELDQATTTKGTCAGDPVVRCHLGNLAVGEVVTISIRVSVWLDFFRGTMHNTASVSSRTRDIRQSNNSDTVRFGGRGFFSWFDHFGPRDDDD
jgi:uncharacterized repeat protein (TIGR01451 family)